ncbi:MAG TPA: hydrogenase maturation protease [Vicinamibacteria bacterium]|nr:hydrogenase maturation protease [Vicinamibacteria bacterium]
MRSTDRPTPLLILGLGNLLCSDDGLGVAAVRRLCEEYAAAEGVEILDGGTLGLSLLPHLLDARAVILVDAIQGDGPPGAHVRLEGDEVAPAAAVRLSPHQVGVADLLDAARLLDRFPERLVLLGLVPSRLDLGFGLSRPVEDALPELVRRTAAEARALGFAFEPRAAADEPPRARQPLAPLRLGM